MFLLVRRLAPRRRRPRTPGTAGVPARAATHRRVPALERIGLGAKRIDQRRLLPFAVIAPILAALYSVGATLYVAHLFSSYATRYGERPPEDDVRSD